MSALQIERPNGGDAKTIQSPMFYLQDSRSYVGNDMLFWGIDGRGYTTDLRHAAQFTLEDAARQNRSRETDIPWPVAYIDARQKPVVDMQTCKRSEALEGIGIELATPAKRPRDVSHCIHCGGFLSEHQHYTGCPKCGGDNAP
jgi:hypothetical protein